MKGLAKAHQFLTFTTPPNLQAAVAYGLMKEDAISRTCAAACSAAATASPPGCRASGSTSCRARPPISSTSTSPPLGEADDAAFCRRLVTDHGVAAIPVSAFYAEGAVRNVVRFCFAKRDATLDAALERLAAVVRRAA